MRENVPIGAITLFLFFVFGFMGYWQYSWLCFIIVPALLKWLLPKTKPVKPKKKPENHEDDWKNF